MKVYIVSFAIFIATRAENSMIHYESKYQFFNSEEIKIVGGDEATPNSIPYQAALLIEASNGRSLCGGSLISKNFILTAAHCLYGEVSSVEAILGAHRIFQTESTQQRFVTTKFIYHPNYDNEVIVNDVGLVQLPNEAILNEYVKIVTLPGRDDASNTYVGSTAIISGWGYFSDNVTNVSEVLRFVEVPVITNEECNKTYAGYILDTNFCTAGTDSKGACSGDSGGPAIIDGKQAGIVSFGNPGGCENGLPSSYTRVASFLDWIEENSDIIIP